MESDFFSSIPEITQFMGIIDERNFIPAPASWVMVVTDIRSSSKAVAEGRYKDVNMIGGAAICAIQNATGSRDWPFVFGGDGATLLLDPAVLPEAEAALVRTRSLARDEFELELRIGIIPISTLRELGADVLVARYEASPGNCLAMFGGGGAELADTLVKSEETSANYVVKEYSLPGLPDLTGLSCRWEPLRSRKGKIVCLLIKPKATDFQARQNILSQFLNKLSTGMGTEISQASPVTRQSMRFSWPPKGLMAEAKATRAEKSLLRRLLQVYVQSFFQWVMELFQRKGGHYNPQVYKEEVRTNSDYCKFDDVLRMVLDCSSTQIVTIRELLEEMHADGQIDFGIFETEQALMTCLLFDLESSQHLHFIDGDEGGFWAAAKGYKMQLSSHDQAETKVNSFS